MAEQQEIMPRSKVMKFTAIGICTLLAALLLARFTGILPLPHSFSPAVAIAFCAVMTISIALFVGWYLKRTDEHDLHANLWSMAWAWVAFALITLSWFILHNAGVVPPPNAFWIFQASAFVAGSIWLWLRFR